MANNNQLGNNKKWYTVMAMLIGLGVMVYFVYIQVTPNVQEEIKSIKKDANQTKAEVKETKEIGLITSGQVNLTKDAVQNLTFNQNISFHNDRVLGKGMNDLGSILIPVVKSIKGDTNEIDDIKFGIDQILNKTNPKNVTLPEITNMTLANTTISLGH